MKSEVPIPILANYFRVPYRGGIPVDYPGRDILLRSRITNISKNGVFVVTDNPQPKGAQFEVSFQLPGTKRPISVECVVRWSTAGAASRESVRGMGLEFTRIDRKDRKVIERAIKTFLTEMRRKEAISSHADVANAPVGKRAPAGTARSGASAEDPFSDTVRDPRSEAFEASGADLIEVDGAPHHDLDDDTSVCSRRFETSGLGTHIASEED